MTFLLSIFFPGILSVILSIILMKNYIYNSKPFLSKSLIYFIGFTLLFFIINFYWNSNRINNELPLKYFELIFTRVIKIIHFSIYIVLASFNVLFDKTNKDYHHNWSFGITNLFIMIYSFINLYF